MWSATISVYLRSCVVSNLQTALYPRRSVSKFEAAAQPRDVALRRLAEQPLVGLFAAINIDWPMGRVFEVSVTRSLMMFSIENNYPTVADGLKGQWAPSAGIIVTLFPGSKKLHWMLLVSDPGVEFGELSSTSKLEKFLGEEDSRNTSYGEIFSRGHSISQEAFDDSIGSYAKAALRGAVGGFLWWGEDEALCKKMRREVGYNWDKLLSAVESSNIEATSKAANEIGRIGINIFSPYFFTGP